MAPLFGVVLAMWMARICDFASACPSFASLVQFVPARVLPVGMMASPLVRKIKQQQQQLHNYSDDSRRVSNKYKASPKLLRLKPSFAPT